MVNNTELQQQGKRSPAFLGSLPIRFLAALSLPSLFLAIYWFGVRPAQLRWGATQEEVARPMPGDELVARPIFYATRAVTIAARPEQIWPWLVQMGYDRAGFYGYDLIENIGSRTGLRSATSILPAFQHPKAGDLLPISAVAQLRFGEIQPFRYLIWRSEAQPNDGAFTWAMYPLDESHTRLVSRIRLLYHRSGQALVLDLFTEFADHVAVPKILEGVKDRAEGRRPEPLVFEAVQVAVWMIALLEFALALALVLLLRSWGRGWLLGLTSGLIFLFALYGHVPLWLGALLPLVVLAALPLSIHGARVRTPVLR